MSTQIYYAYRFKKDKWVEFIDLIHDQMINLVAKIIRKGMKDIKIDEEKYKADVKKYAPKNKRKRRRLRRNIQFRAVMKRCKETSNRLEIDSFDIDCAVNFWIGNEYVYVIPICPRWIMRDLKFPEWVENYCYWNNVDPPDGISGDEWDKRGAVWDEINCGTGKHSHNARRLCHEVINLSHLNHGKWEILKKIFKGVA